MSRDIRVTIAEAFLRLCENKAPNKITVKEIVEEADVSRQSFYNYFPYREDLYIWIYEWHGRLYQMTPLETDSLKLMFKNNWQVFWKYRAYYKGIIKEGMNSSLVSYLCQRTKQFYLDRIKGILSEEELSEELMIAIDFATYGAVMMMIKYISDDTIADPDIITKNIYKNLPPVLKQYFEE